MSSVTKLIGEESHGDEIYIDFQGDNNDRLVIWPGRDSTCTNQCFTGGDTWTRGTDNNKLSEAPEPSIWFEGETNGNKKCPYGELVIDGKPMPSDSAIKIFGCTRNGNFKGNGKLCLWEQDRREGGYDETIACHKVEEFDNGGCKSFNNRKVYYHVCLRLY